MILKVFILTIILCGLTFSYDDEEYDDIYEPQCDLDYDDDRL